MGVDMYFYEIRSRHLEYKHEWMQRVLNGKKPELDDLLIWARESAQYCTLKHSGGNYDKWYLRIYDLPPGRALEQEFDSIQELKDFLYNYLMVH